LRQVAAGGVLSVLHVTLLAMSADTPAALAWLVAYQHGVLARPQVISAGVADDWLRHRIRLGGPWQRLLPGIYLTTTGQPTRDQLQVAAALFAGAESVITGWAALRNYKIRVPETRFVDVLVPADRKRRSCEHVKIHRTRRMPLSVTCDGPVRFAAPARAVADTVLGLTKRSEVRAVVASAVQQGRCTVADLSAELDQGPVRGSMLFRSVLAEVGDGIRSPAEGDFRDLIRKSGLPKPLFNPRLILDGKLLAVPDAWWADRALIVEIDSREWHLAPDDWEATMARDGRLRAVGIRVIHVTPRQVRTEPARILQDIADALREGEPVPGLVTQPAAA
jgi:very-short-patch-repair endonuclease